MDGLIADAVRWMVLIFCTQIADAVRWMDGFVR